MVVDPSQLATTPICSAGKRVKETAPAAVDGIALLVLKPPKLLQIQQWGRPQIQINQSQCSNVYILRLLTQFYGCRREEWEIWIIFTDGHCSSLGNNGQVDGD